MVASIVEYESPFASIRITRARRASSDRILRLRTRRSSSVRSSVVKVSAIWRQRVPVLLQSVQATRAVRAGFYHGLLALARRRLTSTQEPASCDSHDQELYE